LRVSSVGFVALATTIALGLVLSLVEFLFYRSAFLRLRSVDGRFARAPSFALLAFVGLVLAAAGLVALLVLLVRGSSCAVGGALPAGCSTPALAAASVLAVVGAIAFLVGAIGVLVAIWRLGVRYSEGLFKAAAILFIFPFLNLIAAILVIVATSSTERKLRAMPPGGTSAPPVVYPMAPQPPPS
jgi:hypothetical protein